MKFLSLSSTDRNAAKITFEAHFFIARDSVIKKSHERERSEIRCKRMRNQFSTKKKSLRRSQREKNNEKEFLMKKSIKSSSIGFNVQLERADEWKQCWKSCETIKANEIFSDLDPRTNKRRTPARRRIETIMFHVKILAAAMVN
jgi:hypothetical protein